MVTVTGTFLARKLDQRVLLHGFPERQPRRIIEQPAIQPRHDHDERVSGKPPGEGAYVSRALAPHPQPSVAAVTEELRLFAPNLQHLPCEPQLGASVAEIAQQLHRRRRVALEPGQYLAA